MNARRNRFPTAGLVIGGLILLLAAIWAGTPQADGDEGPWVVSAAEGGGYLLNTKTGELWRLRDEVKVPVRGLNP